MEPSYKRGVCQKIAKRALPSTRTLTCFQSARLHDLAVQLHNVPLVLSLSRLTCATTRVNQTFAGTMTCVSP